MTNRLGKMIVLYGANNLGKSTQVQFLHEALKGYGKKVRVIKYPIYDLPPTGPAINAVLREGKQMEEYALQQLYTQNRRDYEQTLRAALQNGHYIMAEDYTGTGIAWGMVRGLTLQELEHMNRNLYKEDIAFVLSGKRFVAGIEENHRNETDQTIWQQSHDIHLELAKRYGWHVVDANRPAEAVHKAIMQILESRGILE